MTAKTRSSVSSDNTQDTTPAVRNRRVEDELRLRELELETKFQIQSITESLTLLKTEFHSWRDSLNEKLTMVNKEVDGLKTRLTIVITLLIGQMAGVPQVLTRILGGL